ncbi:hypothetical protein FRZ61_01330 [Hypericibacter adhaerens]|uniref:Uncharacterized protein n=1 Tax=Hypericibacter adhaerens TaxID=2602016 RepID=A0A5J6MSW6_9PROT|nr:hypothetical protein [Hypericibacter adhaerens]QEX20217.1 hypothetical protein FRZ61_01330 [Hypericibacter adhaerens]
MTVKAREVLDDCRVALSLLEEETDIQRWRIHWAAAVALIRAVGHVLDKVDGGDQIIKQAADAAFKQWKSADPKHEIFREFIERERNNLLKEYRSDVHPLAEVALAVEFTAQPVDGGPPVRFAHVGKIGENIYRPLLDGTWEGDDARDVLSEAIAWWERELAAIEQEVARRQSAQG